MGQSPIKIRDISGLPKSWVFGEGVDSARGVAAIVRRSHGQATQGDRLRKNFLELFLPSEHCKIREKRASKKALNFLEVLLCTFPRCSLIM